MPKSEGRGAIAETSGSRGAKPPSGQDNRNAVTTVRSVEFIRRMRGASQPQLLRGHDGDYYIVKFQNNPQHVRVLSNEMLAARLALLIGLPVPRPAIVEVPPDLIEGNPQLAMEMGVRREPCAPGLHFGSSFPGVPGETLVVEFLPDRLLEKVHNFTSAFLGAFVFDKWTCNCDGRQMIFTRAAAEDRSVYSAWLIDQGFCFNDGEWNFPDSPIRSIYPRRIVYEKVRSLKSFDPFLSAVENLKEDEILECLAGIPLEWCGGETEQLGRLAQKLFQRRLQLRQAIIDAKNCSLRPFPNWK
ncbi:MAG TPA: HipA family kinase [Terriglobia bacterium]|nr:HipA family kinase [Terriglobia bacterium]